MPLQEGVSDTRLDYEGYTTGLLLSATRVERTRLDNEGYTTGLLLSATRVEQDDLVRYM